MDVLIIAHRAAAAKLVIGERMVYAVYRFVLMMEDVAWNH